MRALYESLLDDEEELLNDDSFLIKKWFEENVEAQPDPTSSQKRSYEIKVQGKDVTVVGSLRINGSKCNFRSKVLKIFRFKKLIGDLCIYNLPQKKNYWLPEEIVGDIWIMSGSLTELPKIPERVSGVYLSNLFKLKNLNGCPEKCESLELSLCNKLTSLEGAPKHISKSLTIDYCNQLTSLNGFPEKVEYFFVHNHYQNILGNIKLEFFDKYRDNVNNRWVFGNE
jgi:hypothetical protein